MFSKSSAALVLMLLLPISLLAQDEEKKRQKVNYPESDIFLFEVSIGNEFQITSGSNVTHRPGYENQPFFTADSSRFVFSRSDDYQTDVYEYVLASKETRQITQSVNMEFSPQPSPDGQTISFVTDGETANQSVWKINLKDPSKPGWLLKNQPEREPVGYYSWNHKSGYILYWSRYGFSMRLVHESKDLFHYVSGNAVPSSPHIIPGTENFSFLHRQGNGQVWIKELNPTTLAIRPITAVVGNNTHYTWAPDQSIFMLNGTKLHRWKDKKWSEVADLAKHGIASGTRLAISPDGSKLAVVGVPAK